MTGNNFKKALLIDLKWLSSNGKSINVMRNIFLSWDSISHFKYTGCIKHSSQKHQLTKFKSIFILYISNKVNIYKVYLYCTYV